MSRGVPPSPRRRPRGPSDAGERRRLIVMEWIIAPGNVGLNLTFYAVRDQEQAIKLCDRLHALELPEGAIERTLTVQPIQRFPLTDEELVENLAQQQVYAKAVLAGLAAEAAQSDGGDDDGSGQDA